MLRKNANDKSRSGGLRQDRNKLILLPIYPLPGHIDIQTNKNEEIGYNKKKKTLTLPHAIRISKSQCPAVRRIIASRISTRLFKKGIWWLMKTREVTKRSSPTPGRQGQDCRSRPAGEGRGFCDHRLYNFLQYSIWVIHRLHFYYFVSSLPPKKHDNLFPIINYESYR